jgi:hypothetical protein
MAQILLALYSPGIPPGIVALSFLRRMEVQVESYAREICGISLTNANVSARINAVEPLRLCRPQDHLRFRLTLRQVVAVFRRVRKENLW